MRHGYYFTSSFNLLHAMKTQGTWYLEKLVIPNTGIPAMDGSEITCTLAIITHVLTEKESLCTSMCVCCQPVRRNQDRNGLHYGVSP